MGSMKETNHGQLLSRWTTERTRSLALVVGFAIVATIAACGGDSPSGPATPKTPDGSYNISTINGKTLPVAIFSDTNFMYEVTSGSLSLTTDGKFSVVTKFRQTIPGNVSVFVDSTGGKWLLSGAKVMFTNAQDASVDSATFANGQLTFTEVDTKATTTFVYTRM
jgi:hypothetical protein